jgi:hypothetical protein
MSPVMVTAAGQLKDCSGGSKQTSKQIKNIIRPAQYFFSPIWKHHSLVIGCKI